jgi:DNA ligase-1
MNSCEIFDVIENIAATSSKKEKEVLISEASGDKDFLFVLKAALDPFVTYGIANVPEPLADVAKQQGSFDEDTFELLSMLASRQLTGNAAREEIAAELAYLTEKSQELLKRILLRDLRAGFSASTVNKVIPGLIVTFDCMLAKPFKETKNSFTYPVGVQAKMDGVRVLTFVDFNTRAVKFLSRSGQEYTTFDHLKEEVVEFAISVTHHMPDIFQVGAVLDSEVVTDSFNDTVSAARKKKVEAKDAKLYVFDVLPPTTFQGDPKKPCSLGMPYIARHNLLLLGKESYVGDAIKVLELQIAFSEEAVESMYEQFRDMGLEGAIVKDLKAPYYRKRHWTWSKMKGEETLDLQVIGTIPGTGKYEGKIGALIVNHNGVAVGVGSGLTDELRELDPDLFIDRWIEVEFHEFTPDGSLRHPRFKRFRDDKAVSAQ